VTNSYFGEGSPCLKDPLLTEDRAAAEIDEVERLVGSVSGRVLDIGCGFGRHSIELASRFADVTGIDSSAAMVDAARVRAVEANQFADFICMAAEDFHEVARYDLAICLGTVLGQQKLVRREDDPHRELLRHVKQALRPGGQLVVEVPDRDRAVPALVAAEQIDDGKITRSFDKRESTITERFTASSGDLYRQTYRVFDRTELVDLLHDAGFSVQQVIERGLVEHSASMMTVVAERSR
jgi:SAM-dependent methyltransferase